MDEATEILLLVDESKEKLVIVEGKKDERALRELGFSKIVTLGRPLYQVIEQLPEIDEVMLLVDLDSEGKKLFGELARNIERRGIKIDNRLRNFFLQYSKLRQIEGLPSYMLSLELRRGCRLHGRHTDLDELNDG